jgi:hypothetical protein
LLSPTARERGSEPTINECNIFADGTNPALDTFAVELIECIKFAYIEEFGSIIDTVAAKLKLFDLEIRAHHSPSIDDILQTIFGLNYGGEDPNLHKVMEKFHTGRNSSQS